MPTVLYTISLPALACVLFLFIETVALLGLLLARRFLLPRLHFHDGINDAVGGTVQAVGVFYGITVGLIAVGVWNTYAAGSDLASGEAAAIGGLYRDVSSLPEPGRTVMRDLLRDYTRTVITVVWPAQKKGVIVNDGTVIVDKLQEALGKFEPRSNGEMVRYAEGLRAFNLMIHQRRLRIDAVHGGLSQVMWAVIWVGAVFSIGVAYLFKIEDARVHLSLVGLMAGFLSLVIFMIVINDRPFFGNASIEPDAYQLALDTLMNH